MAAGSGDVADKAGKFIQDRLRELDQERSRLERALAELTGGRIGRRSAGRPKGSGRRKKAAAGRKRTTTTRKKAATGPRKGTRAAQAHRIVKSNPGVNASEIARKMKINPNYVYRVMANLEKEGKVKKSGRKYTATS